MNGSISPRTTIADRIQSWASEQVARGVTSLNAAQVAVEKRSAPPARVKCDLTPTYMIGVAMGLCLPIAWFDFARQSIDSGFLGVVNAWIWTVPCFAAANLTLRRFLDSTEHLRTSTTEATS